MFAALVILVPYASGQNLVISTIWSGTISPDGVATDSSGNLYVADAGNDVVWKLSPTGVPKLFAGQVGVVGSADGPAASASFRFPTGIAVDAAGNVFVADYGNSTIRKISPNGTVSTIAGTVGRYGAQDGPGASATFSLPDGVAVDVSGNIYIADGESSSVRKIDPSGVVSTIANVGFSAYYSVEGIAVDASGNIFFSVGAYQGVSVGFGPIEPAGANVIYKRSTNGIVTLYAGIPFYVGSIDGPALQATFNNPSSLAVDAAGNLFVADAGNGTIRMVSPAGIVSTVAGSTGQLASVDGSAGNARFASPVGLAIDSFGTLFIADQKAVRRGIPGSNTSSPIRFINLSARGMVTPSSALIGGFTIEGSAAQTVLVRAVGPALAQFGVANALANTQVDIFDPTGSHIASSADGVNAVDSASAAALTGAFPLPAVSGDAALVITLKPGPYTAVVSSLNSGSGTALVEVYEVP